MKRVIVLTLSLLMVLSTVALAQAFSGFSNAFESQGKVFTPSVAYAFGVLSAFEDEVSFSGPGPPINFSTLSLIGQAEMYFSADHSRVNPVSQETLIVVSSDQNDFSFFLVELTDVQSASGQTKSGANLTNYDRAEQFAQCLVDYSVYSLVVLTSTALEVAGMSSASVAVNPCLLSSVAELYSSMSMSFSDYTKLTNEFTIAGVTSSTMFVIATDDDEVRTFTDIARGLTFEESDGLALRNGAVLGTTPLAEDFNFSPAFNTPKRSVLLIFD